MALSTIFSAKLTDYRSVIWYGKAVYRHASQVKSFLGQNLGEEYNHLLSTPHISNEALQGTSSAHWLSEYITPKAKPLSEISGEAQERIKTKLSKMLQRIENFSNKLIQSGKKDAIKWGEILQKVVEVPSLSHVLVEGERIVLVCWGFSSEKTEMEKFQLKKNIGEEIKPQKTDKPVEQPEKQEDLPPPTIQEETPPEPKESAEPPSQQPPEPKTPPPPEPQNEPENGKIKKWRWMLASALGMLAILITILFCCTGNKHLPKEEAKIPEIDTNSIVEDENGRKVVENELIIWITDKEASIKDFADQFKEKYPDDSYEIIYYNNEMKRVKIHFPKEQKDSLKKNLKGQFPEFGIIILDETILKHNYVPRDPGFSEEKKSWPFEMIKAYQAWDIGQGSPDIVVAVIDDGFDLSHKEFQGKIVNPYNVPLGNNKPNVGNVGMFHGTHVGGIAIGNNDNSAGVSGIAPKCKFMPIQVGDPNGNMSTTAIIDGVLYAIAQGANVINMSLGMPAPKGLENTKEETQRDLIKNLYKEQEKLWKELFKVAEENNVTIVLAGGNDNVMIGIDPMARSQKTINVSAVDPEKQRASFSNYGDYSTISAPGVAIYNSVPGNSYNYLNGTSMAAPIVTGAVALIKSQNPEITTAEIIEILQQTGLELHTEKKIGKLLQLAKALNYQKGNPIDDVECPDIQEKIDSLKKEIEKLKEQCSQRGNGTGEELVIPENPENPEDFEFAMGKWKSSSNLHNTRTEEPVEIYFEFSRDGSGKMTFLEASGNKCFADLSLELNKNQLNIKQLQKAKCTDGTSYEIYKFQCQAENNRVARCKAKTKSDATVVEFTLQKIH